MDPLESRREELVARVEAATEKDRKRYVGLAVGALPDGVQAKVGVGVARAEGHAVDGRTSFQIRCEVRCRSRSAGTFAAIETARHGGGTTAAPAGSPASSGSTPGAGTGVAVLANTTRAVDRLGTSLLRDIHPG